MNQEQIKKTKLKIVDGQLIGCILYIVSLFISIVIIWNERKRILGQDPFLTPDETQTLTRANKIFILLLILFFLYLNYEGYELAESLGEDTSSIELQILASFLSIIVALIALYVAYQNEVNIPSPVVTTTQNPFI